MNGRVSGFKCIYEAGGHVAGETSDSYFSYSVPPRSVQARDVPKRP